MRAAGTMTALAIDSFRRGPSNEGSPALRSELAFTFNQIDVMSIEAVQEVQTVKGIVPAEYAHVLTGNVNLITRSGGNSWHGSLFENFQSEELNARIQTATTRPPLTFNQFGGSLGGPIKKDKVFVFGVMKVTVNPRCKSSRVMSQRNASATRLPRRCRIINCFSMRFRSLTSRTIPQV